MLKDRLQRKNDQPKKAWYKLSLKYRIGGYFSATAISAYSIFLLDKHALVLLFQLLAVNALTCCAIILLIAMLVKIRKVIVRTTLLPNRRHLPHRCSQ